MRQKKNGSPAKRKQPRQVQKVLVDPKTEQVTIPLKALKTAAKAQEQNRFLMHLVGLLVQKAGGDMKVPYAELRSFDGELGIAVDDPGTESETLVLCVSRAGTNAPETVSKMP